MRPIRRAACKARVAAAFALAIMALVTTMGPIVASELIGAVSPRSGPAVALQTLAHGRQRGSDCETGRCASGPQHHRHADRCDGRCANGSCGKPGCPAQCPVRPDRFGFYGTQWRNWPGQGVVQASLSEAATPARPPKSEIPDADAESPSVGPALPQEGEPGAEEPAAEPLPPAKVPAASPDQPRAPPKDAAPLDSPFEDEPAAEPAEEQPAAEEPAMEKPSAPAAEENLFDEASHRRRRTEILSSLQQSAMRTELARQEALRQRARQVPPAAMPAVPQGDETAGQSGLRAVAHEEPVAFGAAPPRDNPLR